MDYWRNLVFKKNTKKKNTEEIVELRTKLN